MYATRVLIRFIENKHNSDVWCPGGTYQWEIMATRDILFEDFSRSTILRYKLCYSVSLLYCTIIIIIVNIIDALYNII